MRLLAILFSLLLLAISATAPAPRAALQSQDTTQSLANSDAPQTPASDTLTADPILLRDLAASLNRRHESNRILATALLFNPHCTLWQIRSQVSLHPASPPQRDAIPLQNIPLLI